MSEVPYYLWLIPLLPLASAVLIAFLGPRLLRRHSHWPCILALAVSCALSFRVATAVYVTGSAEVPTPAAVKEYYRWITVEEPADTVYAGLTLRADALSAMMLVFVTLISTLIAIYSVGYMHGDEGYPRFFAEIALFVFSMTLLALADNFLVLYAGWEGVGLCSYLLIGFWFARPSAAAAARKAFLVTRLGDTGMILGILVLWFVFHHRLDFDHVLFQGHEQDPAIYPWLTLICLLLFCGAVGKSAQFPLHVWLPDAMEGPTPVSALIHAATMVTAGVYLVARCTPLFAAAPAAQLVVAGIGCFTALLAALIALTQNDLKRVLAYSTISQLGYMFLALGSAVPDLVTIAVAAGLFHLFTHAFFKALLFLSAGSVMHAMGNVIDMRRFRGLAKVMPVTHITFLCGALALAGFPLLSGFWSKDEILAATFSAAKESPSFRSLYLAFWAIGLATAGLTAFYTFRAYFLTFQGELMVPPEADAAHHGHAAAESGPHHHGPTEVGRPAHPQAEAAHAPAAPRASYESPTVVTVPLMILAVFAVGVGFVLGPMVPESWRFAHFLAWAPGLPLATGEREVEWGLMALSGIIALGGIAVAWLMYQRQPSLPGKLAAAWQWGYQLSLNKFHFDELYYAFIVRPLSGLAVFCRLLDQYLVDGLVDLIGYLPRLLGARFRPVQNGLVQFYALAMVLGLTVFLLAMVYRL
jgi:proton-translocating NADH-quinone oxidoreductase chain L